MAPPNLKSPATITGDSDGYAVGITLANVLENPAASNKVLKVNSIRCTNVDGVNAADISVSKYDGTTDRYLAKVMPVPAKSAQIISDKETYFYLKEGQSIRALASAVNDLELFICWEEVS
jgi:hypothetical protein